MQQIDQLINILGLDAFDYTEGLITLSQKLKVKRPSYLVLTYLCTTLLLMYLNIAPQFQSDLIGFGYPAYKTYKALNSINDEQQQRWIVYWIVYCIIILSNRLILQIAQANTLFYILRSLLFIYLFTVGLDKIQSSVQNLNQKYGEYIEKKLRNINLKLT